MPNKHLLFLAFILIILISIFNPYVEMAVNTAGLAALLYCVTKLYKDAKETFYAQENPEPYIPEFEPSDFTLDPGNGDPHMPLMRAATYAKPDLYPGAIDVDESGYDVGEYGHTDRHESDSINAINGLNPYNVSRTSAQYLSEPCIDDEANTDEIDGDERMNYQSLSRNDPTRPTIGTMNRHRNVDYMVREELDYEEDSRWWGRDEL